MLQGWLAASAFASDAVIRVDPASTAERFDGIGAVSAGASTRLLIDYPEPQRSEILDLLFRPKYGASFQRLKVEIGGEVNSTDGTEPTHMRSAADLNFQRGYEWWLMKEARKRNPAIVLDCLAWGAPSWLGDYYSQATAEYIARFLEGARTEHGLEIQYVGVRNERPYTVSWIKLLRTTLDAHHFENVQIVGGDQVADWAIADQIAADSALAAAVGVIGVHYPGYQPSAAAQATGKPVWSSEDGPWADDWSAARILGTLINRNYAVGKMTATEIWSLVSSYYSVLPLPDSGPVQAREPWSGHYEVRPTLWALAHTTQFTEPGWHYLSGEGSGTLPGGGSFATLLSPSGSDFSTIIETFGATAVQTIDFQLSGNRIASDRVHVWRTSETAPFREAAPILIQDQRFSLPVDPEAIYTITTTTGQQLPQPQSASSPFPAPYVENFDSYPAAATPKYLSDQAGTFEVVETGGSHQRALRQIAETTGIPWADQYTPWTIFGDRAWADYEVSCDAWLKKDGFISLFGRVGKVVGFSDPVPFGYIAILRSNPGRWELWRKNVMIASGSASFAANVWHSIRLVLDGSHLQLWNDGVQLADVADASYPAGLAAIGSGWHGALFDNLVVRPLHTRKNLAETAAVSASSVWSDHFLPQFAADHNRETRWVAGGSSGNGQWLQFDFTNSVTFNRAVVWDDDNRITNCVWQAWQTDHWRTLAAGVQPQNAPGTLFPSVTADRVRLLINSAATPIVREIGLFNDDGPPPGPRINEWTLVAAETNSASGVASPWFELYNPAATSFSLAGFYLSSSRSNSFQFPIPENRSIPAGGFLRVWADQHNELNGADPRDLHVNFTLERNGVLGLYQSDGTPVDFVELQSPEAGASLGSNPDGASRISKLALPSGGGSNEALFSAIEPSASGSVIVSFRGAAFARYQLENTSSLFQSVWTAGEISRADGSGTVRFAVPANGASVFFRAIRLAP